MLVENFRASSDRHDDRHRGPEVSLISALREERVPEGESATRAQPRTHAQPQIPFAVLQLPSFLESFLELEYLIRGPRWRRQALELDERALDTFDQAHEANNLLLWLRSQHKIHNPWGGPAAVIHLQSHVHWQWPLVWFE